MLASVFEVFTLCAFVFGVACKLPPSLTILVLNGCFCFPIGRYLFHQVTSRKQRHQNHIHNGYTEISDDDEQLHTETEENLENTHEQQTEHQTLKRPLKYLLTILESSGFVLQSGALVGVAVLLATSFSPSGAVKHYFVATYILIPVSLFIISVVWSGWIQSYTIKSSDANSTARYKSGKQ